MLPQKFSAATTWMAPPRVAAPTFESAEAANPIAIATPTTEALRIPTDYN
jgi:hypothetical protein